MRTAFISALVAFGGGAMALGVLVGMSVSKGRDHVASPPRVIPPNPRETLAPRVAMDSLTTRLSEEDKVALGRMIRDEVLAAQAARPDTRADVHSAPPSETTEPVMSDDAIHAYDQARTVIDDAVARGSWSDGDRMQLRANLRPLPKERRDELLQALVVAINQQRLHLASHGPPF